MTSKLYPSRKQFVEMLAEKGNKIDINKSMFMVNWGFVLEDGTTCACPNAMTFANTFNKLFGEIVDVNKTRSAGGRNKFLVTFFEQKEEEVVVKEEVKDTPVTEAKVAVEKKVPAKKKAAPKKKATKAE